MSEACEALLSQDRVRESDKTASARRRSIPDRGWFSDRCGVRSPDAIPYVLIRSYGKECQLIRRGPFTLLVFAQAVAGCASVQGRPAPIAKVHKAAIVAFGWSVDLSSESDKNISSSIGDAINTSKAIAALADGVSAVEVPQEMRMVHHQHDGCPERQHQGRGSRRGHGPWTGQAHRALSRSG